LSRDRRLGEAIVVILELALDKSNVKYKEVGLDEWELYAILEHGTKLEINLHDLTATIREPEEDPILREVIERIAKGVSDEMLAMISKTYRLEEIASLEEVIENAKKVDILVRIAKGKYIKWKEHLEGLITEAVLETTVELGELGELGGK